MERMEYDPEGGDYKPITEHETGSTFLVLGVIMLIAALGWLLFVGWDIQGRRRTDAGSFRGRCGHCPGSNHPRIYQKETANKLDGRHNPCNC